MAITIREIIELAKEIEDDNLDMPVAFVLKDGTTLDVESIDLYSDDTMMLYAGDEFMGGS